MLKGDDKALSTLKGDKEAIKDGEYTLKCNEEDLKGDKEALNNFKWRWAGIQRDGEVFKSY